MSLRERSASLSQVDGAALENILQRNKIWAKKKIDEDPHFFTRRQDSQNPQFLFIGCADSRVSAELLLDVEPGEVFVHRNIANVVVATDNNCMSVLQYAVEVLKVPHIIVCGHYGCGGVKAALDNNNLGLIENWLTHIRDVHRIHRDELANIENAEERTKRFVELNVIEQCVNLLKSPIVRNARMKTGKPHVHGLVYDLSDGELKELSTEIRDYMSTFEYVYEQSRTK